MILEADKFLPILSGLILFLVFFIYLNPFEAFGSACCVGLVKAISDIGSTNHQIDTHGFLGVMLGAGVGYLWLTIYLNSS